jgi:hypothetical protein
MYAIEYDGRTKRDENFLCASDAAFGDNQIDRRAPRHIYTTRLEGLSTGELASVTISTTEAELLAIFEAGMQLFWWKRYRI